MTVCVVVTVRAQVDDSCGCFPIQQRSGNQMAPTGSGSNEHFLLLMCSHLEAVEVVLRPCAIILHCKHSLNNCHMCCCGRLLHAADVMQSRSQPARGHASGQPHIVPNAVRTRASLHVSSILPIAECCGDCSLILRMPDCD